MKIAKSLALAGLMAVLPLSAMAASEGLIAHYLEKAETLTSETMTFYIMDAETTMDIPVYFVNGMTQIPYLCIEDWPALMTKAYDEPSYAVNCESLAGDADAYVLARENGSDMVISFQNGTEITYSDLDAFYAPPQAANPLDIIVTGDTNTEEVSLLQHSSRFYRTGGVRTISLTDYQIAGVWMDGKGYLPLQTFSDLVLNHMMVDALYNGKCVLIQNGLTNGGETETDLYKIYYEGEKAERSDELIQFTYNELCLALDNTYGLMAEHDIKSFDSFFVQTGMIQRLLSRDAADVYIALLDLVVNYFADGHSYFGDVSSLTATKLEYTEIQDVGVENLADMMIVGFPYQEAAEKVYPDGIPGYEEVGNTAYITFDTFTMDSGRDYYNMELTANRDDTVELMLYANRQIHREGSPIENVVIDLTNNGGGMADAAMCVASWFLGQAGINLEDMKTDARGIVRYNFDGDLDHQIDTSRDSVKGYHLYCLISPASFSCGNLLPATFKASDKVTLIGRASGGGACVVSYLSTADGNSFQLSGQQRINTVSNGSYYSVDQGVEPDIYIDKIEHLYDRQYLTDYINGLI